MPRLHLIESPGPDPLPKGERLANHVRRPGELHDVLAVGHFADGIAAKATAARIPFDVAATLLLELALLRSDLTALGAESIKPPRVDAPGRRLSAAEAAYVQVLTFRRHASACAARRAAVPVRLIPRITEEVLRASVDLDLENAIAWETAAIFDGRTMVEFGVLVAARAARRR